MFFLCFARTIKSLILFQFRAPVIVPENSLWFCSQNGLPCWAWLTSLVTQKWHLTRQGLFRAVKGLGCQGSLPEACPKPSHWDEPSFPLIQVYKSPWDQFIWSIGSARDIALFWKAPMLESILVPQLGMALRFTVEQDQASENAPDAACNGHWISSYWASVNIVTGQKSKVSFYVKRSSNLFQLNF